MKYIKIYDDLRPINKVEDAAFEKLFNAFEMLFSKLGYSSIYYKENRSIEFHKEGKYIFCLKVTSNLIAYLIYDKSISNEDEIQNFIPEYLKSIKGLYQRDDYYFEIAPYMYKSSDLSYKIDKIIEEISLEDFQLKFDTFKYNI